MSMYTEIKAAYMEHWARTGEIPDRIIVSPRAYQAIMRDLEACRAIQLRAKEEDGRMVPDYETIFGMKIEAPEETGSGYVCIGGTVRQLS